MSRRYTNFEVLDKSEKYLTLCFILLRFINLDLQLKI